MTTHTASPTTGLLPRPVLFFILLAAGLAVFFFGANYFDIFPTNKNLAYNVSLSVILLAAALWLKRNRPAAPYWRAAYALFCGSLAFPIAWVTLGWRRSALGWLNLDSPSSAGIAADKLCEATLVVALLIVLSRAAGIKPGAIFLGRGKWKLGLGIGALVFFNYASAVFLFSATRFSTPALLSAAAGWGLVFSLANGLMEELWLRGVFLQPYTALFGGGGALLLTSLVFAAMHTGAVYLAPVAIPFMFINTFTLGLACGYLMIKTGSLWGAVLIHAGADYYLFLALLANA
jgi:membrane protease YdiL (CAAX protease family)